MRRSVVVGALTASCLAILPAVAPTPAAAQEEIGRAASMSTSATLQAPAVAPAIEPASLPVAEQALAANAAVTTAVSAATVSAATVSAATVSAAVGTQAPVASKQAAFLHFTTASPQAIDRRGVEPSLYRGRYFRPSVEEVRRCIVRRESSGVYTVRGGGGNRYYGAYQMNDELADGATWMMLPEAKRLLGESAARTLMERLREKPVTTWSRYWQDAAFFTIYNWEHTGSGRAHWAGGRWRC